MTLKEKFDSVILCMDYKDSPKQKDLCEEIADDYAIGFAEWLLSSSYLFSIGMKEMTFIQALEIYKKEKGL